MVLLYKVDFLYKLLKQLHCHSIQNNHQLNRLCEKCNSALQVEKLNPYLYSNR